MKIRLSYLLILQFIFAIIFIVTPKNIIQDTYGLYCKEIERAKIIKPMADKVLQKHSQKNFYRKSQPKS